MKDNENLFNVCTSINVISICVTIVIICICIVIIAIISCIRYGRIEKVKELTGKVNKMDADMEAIKWNIINYGPWPASINLELGERQRIKGEIEELKSANKKKASMKHVYAINGVGIVVLIILHIILHSLL